MIRIIALLILMGSSTLSFSTDKAPSANELSALKTVNSYLVALMAGDTGKAQLFLTPQVAKQRRALLNNPSYPAQLQKTYANASYEVVEAKELGEKKVQVDVKVMLNRQDSVHSRFLLKNIDRQFLIFSEQ